MGPLTISFIGFAAILVLAFLRFPLALSMGLVGVIVAVKKNKSVTSDQILYLFNEKVAKYKIPKEVIFVNNIPKNALGKIEIDKVKQLVN